VVCLMLEVRKYIVGGMAIIYKGLDLWCAVRDPCIQRGKFHTTESQFSWGNLRPLFAG
jgi:hypothetical protein